MPGMLPFVLLILGGLVGALLGSAVAGPLGGVLGVMPSTAVGLLFLWQSRRQAKALRAEIDRLNALTSPVALDRQRQDDRRRNLREDIATGRGPLS